MIRGFAAAVLVLLSATHGVGRVRANPLPAAEPAPAPGSPRAPEAAPGKAEAQKSARAHPPAKASTASAVQGPAILLVMESSAGVSGAARVRSALRHQLGMSVISAAEASKLSAPPVGTLAVALERGAGNVAVIYLDRRGGSDMLTAPTPPLASDITSVVTALAAALLERHAKSIRRADEHLPDDPILDPWLSGSDADFALVRASRAIYAALNRMGVVRRRTGRLSADEF